ncbi:MAG: GLUG motif-containing protein [Planctomycetota bacterium]|jgi:hypothetical protein
MSGERRPGTIMPSVAFFLLLLVPAARSNARYSGGTGEPNDPYRIATPNDLNDIGNHVEDFNKCFVMVNDINLAAYGGAEFNIIGYHRTWWDKFPFDGVFDGNGFCIRNFSYDDSNRDAVGIFGYTDANFLVTALSLEDVNVVGSFYVGSLVGLNYGTVSGCRATGCVSGDENVGGMVGMNEQGGLICNCSSDVELSNCVFAVGGLVGYNFCGTVAASWSAGAVQGDGNTDYAGGLAGFSRQGTIVDSRATGRVSGHWYIGGLIGNNETSIYDCYATGDVNCVADGGGLVGRNYLPVVNCYARGNVSAGDYAGGLIGWDVAGGALKCYSTGAVSASTAAGGLVGDKSESVQMIDCFWDMDSSGQTSSDGGEGKTTLQMMTESTFTNAGWDFVDVWAIGENQTYPFLRVYPAGDMNHDDKVDWFDLGILAGQWLQSVE